MNIETRLDKLEREIMPETGIPEEERIITIAAHTEEEFEAIKKDRLAKLHYKYGANISAEGMLIIHIKKFN